MAKASLSEGSETLKEFSCKVSSAQSKLKEELDKIIKLLDGYGPVWQDAVYDHMAEVLDNHRRAMEKNLQTLDDVIAALDKMAEYVSLYQNS